MGGRCASRYDVVTEGRSGPRHLLRAAPSRHANGARPWQPAGTISGTISGGSWRAGQAQAAGLLLPVLAAGTETAASRNADEVMLLALGVIAGVFATWLFWVLVMLVRDWWSFRRDIVVDAELSSARWERLLRRRLEEESGWRHHDREDEHPEPHDNGRPV